MLLSLHSKINPESRLHLPFLIQQIYIYSAHPVFFSAHQVKSDNLYNFQSPVLPVHSVQDPKQLDLSDMGLEIWSNPADSHPYAFQPMDEKHTAHYTHPCHAKYTLAKQYIAA